MKAIILAAGRGERMRPLTDHTPKPLLLAGGKPLLQHHIEALALAGIHDLVINVAHLGDQIEEYFADGAALDVRIMYSREPEGALETGGGIYHALPLLENAPFVVVNGDVFSDYPFASLTGKPCSLAHLVMVPNPSQHPEGDFSLVDGLLSEQGVSRYTYSGIGVYHPQLFASCRPGRFPLGPLLREVMGAGRVTGELYTGVWSDVGTPERLRMLNEELQTSGE